MIDDGLAGLSQRRVALEKKKKKLEKELEDVNKEINRLHKPILLAMVRSNLKNIPLENGPTLYKRRSIECNKKKDIPTQHVCALLKEENLDWLVAENYSAQKLKTYLKEQEEEHGINEKAGPAAYLPESIRQLFNVAEITKVVVLGA